MEKKNKAPTQISKINKTFTARPWYPMHQSS